MSHANLGHKPPFRADQVGSLLRPEPVKEARRRFFAGEIDQDTLTAVENDAIREIVAKQKDIGLAAVTDGELRRSWWHFDFLEHLEGVQGYEPEQGGIQFHNVTTRPRAIRVVGKLGFPKGHPMLAHFRFLLDVAGEHVAKMTIPSPSMLHFRGELADGVYPDEDEMFHDLALAYQDAIRAFYDAGCRYLQLDDTAWAYLCSEEQKQQMIAKGRDPKRLEAKYAETINKALEAKPADMTITMHICRGNFRSTWISSGGYEPVAETLFQKLNIDGFFLEYDTERAGGFEPLRFVNRKSLSIVLGLITSKHGALEDKEEVKRRIHEATRYVPLEQLCLSPQCGFASTEEGNLLTEDEQWAKLRHVVEIAHEVWG
ncbi:5-methyltetrahydropteroyltriglutamate--homocysteine S-methyltransferase [Alicyclobacillus mali (ex Roth et al. 2021)]|uniref:5-methyltetrahydropteroyltriglutamate-- homocysteine S-methyltransferase n=1 Tax=Alicyclobacillus mali (ex Roth et al. 2021) TaxID=1123961 RepID=UPI001A8F09DD|nr:5-methyltetrahydropteroyltriglutamate--homocysteine S-methyltransferase [Alicyclobacillus mali (ex Roth et al. 2021)]